MQYTSEAVTQRYSPKVVFSEILQNSQENTCLCQSLFDNKLQAEVAGMSLLHF